MSETVTVHDVLVPDRTDDDYPTLAAWYSGYSYAEHYRKVVLAQVRELVRADFALRGEKCTESRLDDLARIHPTYLSFLHDHLLGRTKYEKAFLEQGGMR